MDELVLVRVKLGSSIEHEGKLYKGGALAQLPKVYVGFHNQNVEVLNRSDIAEKALNLLSEEEDTGAPLEVRSGLGF